MAVSEKVAELFEEVISSLGGGLIDVELEERDLKVCFRKAKRTFQQKGHNTYRRKFIPIEVDKTKMVYQLPENVDTVVKILKPGTAFNVEDAFSMVAFNDLFNDTIVGGGCGGFDNLSYEMTLDRMERLKRMSAYEAQFVFDQFSKELSLLKKPEAKTTWFVECYMNLGDDEYAQVDWIIRWTIAEAKEMIGMAYRKFQSLPGPSGDMSLAGSEYIQEAAQEKERLLEDILNFVDGEVDYMEIRFG